MSFICLRTICCIRFVHCLIMSTVTELLNCFLKKPRSRNINYTKRLNGELNWKFHQEKNESLTTNMLHNCVHPTAVYTQVAKWASSI